ncbi:low-affinity phosphate transporter [Mortierella hygrophila]|uniref:Low-affinity phosphate transporter n=1 Tax=Mortierella hygrophila TaxID=979708 RepID=A0A9P6FD35_9FUNG|nr:low-affinity phosphate transporter [Mortierella hygrophila]
MVKFSHSLQFNTVPDWANEYIAYSNLKKTLYAIEKYNVQATIGGSTPRRKLHPSDMEQGFAGDVDSVSEKQTAANVNNNFTRFLGLKGQGAKDAAVVAAAAAVAAGLHNGSDIFPPESAAFEHGLSKELAKITTFYIRKERELSTELEAVDRQWQLEEKKQKKEGESDEAHQQNEVDESNLTEAEKAQLKEKMGWDRDGLVDQGSSVGGGNRAKTNDNPTTVNGSTVGDGSVQGQSKRNPPGPISVGETAIAMSEVDGSEYNPKSQGRSSVGDLTEIVWRRECLIESDDEEKKAKQSKSGIELPQSQVQVQTQSQQASTSQLAPKTSMNAGRSLSAMRDFVTGHHANPNLKPSTYTPLTTEALLRRRLIDTYMLLSELKSYVALNYLGFQKIVKKHDKLARCTTQGRYMSTVVDLSAPFQAESRQQLDAQILRLQAIYARTCTNGSMALAAKELRTHLREYIVWERNTVWRDMVGQERKAEGARAVELQEQEPWMFFNTPIRFISASDARHILLGLIGCVIFAILMSVSLFDTQEQNRCFAILITVAFLWATEVFPLFATALLVPLLTVLCQVMRDPTTKETLSTSAATKLVFSAMFSPTIMLLLGGFTIASALSKYGIAKAIASIVLSKAGTDPKWVLLANMFVATIASMFISNVAAPVLCFSLIQSILRTLPHKSSFGPCLIMGIALASNVGGMASPISSPQNIITVQNMSPAPSWGNWFAVSLPLCLIIDLVIWAWLMLLWRPQRDTPSVPSIRATQEPITFQKVFICFVTVATIILWCIENTFQEQLGDMGIIAILPLIAFFGTGLLTKEDFNNFLWTVIVLAMGGVALGKAVDSSGLLDTIAHKIQEAVADLSMWVVLVIFSCLTLVFATFVSHTVAAVIILPIVQQVGMSFADPHPRLLVMGTGLICSAAMGLPVSGFPNINAIALTDSMGKPYLTTMDFVKTGVPLSVIAGVCVVTIGYGIMLAMGY